MIVKYYKCEFKSDIILNASSNTQGNIELLDFIPGSNFLGMVARYYDEFSNSFEIFHSGKVKFCDGSILINGKKSYKIPLTYHNLKLNTDIYYNRLCLEDEEEKQIRDEQHQLKQVRSGYMNMDFEIFKPKYNYSQKSAHDKRLRRSADKEMYGYSALQKGTSWAFKIVYENENLVKEIEERLLGKKRLGKSKTTEYGQVFIDCFDNSKKLENFTSKDGYTYLYANSRLVLIDGAGNPTLEPTIENLRLKSGTICWEKTQIKTTNYSPYNFKRQGHDSARNCIQKGSVIAIKDLKDNLNEIDTFIGAFQSEGFGEVIVNPKFLETKKPNLREYQTPNIKENLAIKDNLLSFLKYKQSLDERKLETIEEVKRVYEKFIGPSKSQWGQIRSMATSSKDSAEFIRKFRDFTTRGKEGKQWKNRRDKLEEAISSKNTNNWQEFVKLLAIITSKHTKGGKNE